MAKSIIASLRIGPEKNFTYLIACETTGETALIDPSFEFDRVISWVKDHGGSFKSEVPPSHPRSQ